jgi:hypothetical protein
MFDDVHMRKCLLHATHYIPSLYVGSSVQKQADDLYMPSIGCLVKAYIASL